MVLRDIYRLVATLDWPRDEFDEKAQLLAPIAQLAWSQSLKRGNALETREWEQACLKYFASQECVQQLLAMPVANWSSSVCERFLSDRAFLLGLWGWLYSRADVSPRPVLALALVAYNWLSTHRGSAASLDEDAYLLGQFSIVLAGSSRTLGEHRKSREWLDVAETWCTGFSSADALQARIEYGRLAGLYDVHQFSRALLRIPNLIDKFEGLGLDDDVAKSKFLRAACLKERGDREALSSFLLLKTDPVVTRQPWFKAIVLINLADLHSGAGDLRTAVSLIKEAEGLLADSGRPYAQAHFYGVTAEILRDHGNIAAAVDYYSRALEIYESVGMAVYAAYLRLMLAEALITCGRVDRAADEIVAALPIIEQEKLVREGIAAVGLLRVSLSGRRLDARALRALRESLSRSNQQAEP